MESNPSTKRVITIYFGSFQQPIAFYPETKTEEILKLISMLLKFPPNQELLFLDEDGIPVVFSNAIPSGTKLHVQKFQSETDKLVSEQESNKVKIPESVTEIKWKWLKPQNTSHKLKNDDLTVYQPVNETCSYVWGSLVIDKGSCYFTLLFDPMMCCVNATVYKTGVNYENIGSEHVNHDLPNLFEYNKLMATNAHIEVGFVVNMDKKKFVIVDPKEKKVKKVVDLDKSWTKVSPLLFFKHEVGVTIVNHSLPVPDWVTYL